MMVIWRKKITGVIRYDLIENPNEGVYKRSSCKNDENWELKEVLFFLTIHKCMRWIITEKNDKSCGRWIFWLLFVGLRFFGGEYIYMGKKTKYENKLRNQTRGHGLPRPHAYTSVRLFLCIYIYIYTRLFLCVYIYIYIFYFIFLK
jgi:hypothetical protein